MKIKAVILAGGSGERFWPLSTPQRPKQFLSVFGGESLIRQSVSRLAGLIAPEDIYIVTTKDLVAVTRKELDKRIPSRNIIGEPMRRDTGAALALATGICNEGVMCVFSSDQMVASVKKFQRAVRKAVSIASSQPKIVTIGIKPDYPATGFGYVEPKTGRFVEKPDAKTAKSYVRRGYLWNAGMFIGRVDTFRTAFSRCAPALVPLASGIRSLAAARLAGIYEPLPKISFDYAVMEKFDGVAVVPGDFGWDDVGSFAAFDKYFPHDQRGNVLDGQCTVVESDGNVCVAKSAKIALLGVKNLVVVTTPHGVLVAEKSRLAEMKKLFAK